MKKKNISNSISQNCILETFKIKGKLYKIIDKHDNLLLLSLINNQTTNYIIYDKKQKKVLTNIISKIIFNEDAVKVLKNDNFNENIKIYDSYDGLIVSLFNHENKWFLSTQKYIHNLKYFQLFNECLEDFNIDNLNKKYCYTFILVHYKKQKIIDYSLIDNKLFYKELIPIFITEKYTQNEVKESLLNFKNLRPKKFKNIDELLTDINNISDSNEKRKLITTEGYFIIKKVNNNFVLFKIQTNIYREIKKIVPIFNNKHKTFLELYKKNNLTNYIAYFTKYKSDIIKRIHNSMCVLSQEILNIYHSTRQQNNPEMYNLLGDCYKKSLYDLHGIFINFRKNNTDLASKSISVHNVYHYIKNLDLEILIELLKEHNELINNKMFENIINKTSLDLKALTLLIFNN